MLYVNRNSTRYVVEKMHSLRKFKVCRRQPQNRADYKKLESFNTKRNAQIEWIAYIRCQRKSLDNVEV